MKKRNVTPWILTAVFALVAAASLALAASANPASSTVSTREERLGLLWQDFHNDGSEFNIQKFFPDAAVIFTEEKQEPDCTRVLKHYYSQEIDKTIVACDRNRTLAVCPGRVEQPVSIEGTPGCLMHVSLILSLVNYTSANYTAAVSAQP